MQSLENFRIIKNKNAIPGSPVSVQSTLAKEPILPDTRR